MFMNPLSSSLLTSWEGELPPRSFLGVHVLEKALAVCGSDWSNLREEMYLAVEQDSPE